MFYLFLFFKCNLSIKSSFVVQFIWEQLDLTFLMILRTQLTECFIKNNIINPFSITFLNVHY